jgi:hypothetical protein
VERFIFHHPALYRQLLTASLVLFGLAGTASVVTGQKGALPAIRSDMVPQLASVKSTPAVPKPKGWEAVSQLPGKDGSTPVQAATAVPAAPSLPTIPLGSSDVRALGRSLNAVEFGDQHWPALQALWNRESGWNPNARNRYSGACGIPQALPCSKISDHSPQGQIEWGLHYIKSRYGNPSNAWQFWMSHHWY